ncbi:MAG: outer membrane beta-barrel protein [Bacteroidetes bacterium]|nr:outer membrane beta-barrel protein [Bacteroidota bacterium]
MVFKDKRILSDGFGFKAVLAFLLVLVSVMASSQITNGNVNPDETGTTDKKEKKEKTETASSFSEDSLTGSDFYIGGLFQYTYRSFEDQSTAHYYQDWESQTSSYNGGFNLGLVMKLTGHLHLDIGFSYYGNGENYTFEDSLTDSTFTYQNTYRQMALPVRLRYSYGQKLQVFGFAGLAPLNILNIHYESSYTTAEGTKVDRELQVEKDGFATFNLMITAGMGIQYNIKHVGFTLYPEFRRHLLNTYSTKTISMDHKMYSVGINAGLVLRF